jgi:hypothetical protein
MEQQENHPWTTQTAVQATKDLQSALRGSAGGGHLTPSATDTDGRTLRDWLTGLRSDIEHFLDRRSPE